MSDIPVLTLYNRLTQLSEKITSRYLEKIFSIDNRAIAVFRMVLGSVVITDVLIRLGYLNFFYTNAGVYPVEVMLQYNDGVFASLATVMSSSIAAVIVFSLCLVSATMVVVGYKPRVMMFMTLILVLVIHHRNIFTLNSGDFLLRCLLLWGVFLPLGHKWSVDSIIGTEIENRNAATMVFSGGTTAVLSQMLLVYLVNVSQKVQGEEWVNGEAAEHALNAGHMVTPIGEFLVNFEVLMTIGTYWWMSLLIATPLLLIPEWRVRIVMASLFIAAHTGMALTLKIGLFPFTAISALLLFYPSEVWNVVERVTEKTRGVVRSTVENNVRCESIVKQKKLFPVIDTQTTQKLLNNVIPVLLLCIAISGALTSAGVVQQSETINDLDKITLHSNEQNWAVYAPSPVAYEMWFIHELTLSSGKTMNIYHEDRTLDERPDDIAISKPIRKYRQKLIDADNEELKQAYGEYYCSKGHEIPESQIEEMRLKLTRTTYGDNPETNSGTLIKTKC